MDGPWVLEDASKSTYQEFLSSDGFWIQRWLDTADSHRYKFQFACDEELAGVGFWALGYDGNDDPIWDALREVHENCPGWWVENGAEDSLDGFDGVESPDTLDSTGELKDSGDHFEAGTAEEVDTSDVKTEERIQGETEGKNRA